MHFFDNNVWFLNLFLSEPSRHSVKHSIKQMCHDYAKSFGAIFFKCNIDDIQHELAREYKIEDVSTILVYLDGSERGRLVKPKGEEELSKLMKELNKKPNQ